MTKDELRTALEDLLVTEDEALRQLALAAKKIIAIERETGRPIYKINTARLSQKDRLVLELVADRLFAASGLRDVKTNRETLSKRTGIKRDIIAARFKELRDEGWIERSGDSDRLTTTGLVKATNRVEQLQSELVSTNEGGQR